MKVQVTLYYGNIVYIDKNGRSRFGTCPRMVAFRRYTPEEKDTIFQIHKSNSSVYHGPCAGYPIWDMDIDTDEYAYIRWLIEEN
jgi:hypothetical protein